MVSLNLCDTLQQVTTKRFFTYHKVKILLHETRKIQNFSWGKSPALWLVIGLKTFLLCCTYINIYNYINGPYLTVCKKKKKTILYLTEVSGSISRILVEGFFTDNMEIVHHPPFNIAIQFFAPICPYTEDK